ncbi:MAG: inositol monophosphatase [Bdellovibrio sp. CG10_big_fil_rev_8_21_14_0_10_47_8]|nr:MAG: inositol monophosphatase [Bdellovibrio sp. CG10_big_fil_rev_8_21_14_0_10_47_8]
MNLGTNWNAALYQAIHAAKLGREVLLHYYGRLEHIEEKHLAGLVSEADKESEKAIFTYLKKNFPQDEFVGEESTLDSTKIQAPKTDGRWIVDPLDGTTNYIHRFPIFCVSIGYEWKGQMQLAVIDIPKLGEVYTAIRGQGAFVNGRRLQVSETTQIRDSLLATGFFGENEPNLQEQMKVFSDMVRRCRGVRRAGAAAVDLAMVARGVFDGFWEKGLKPWDSAAGILLVEEAGGKVCTYRGKTYSPYNNSLIATNAHLADTLVKDFASFLSPDTD